jgi:hypothetical protein
MPYQVIASHSQGELCNPETNLPKKFKELWNKSWRPEKDGVLNRKFIKWLGSLSEEDHQKFCKYILNRSGDN